MSVKCRRAYGSGRRWFEQDIGQRVGTYGDPSETDGPKVFGGPLWKRLPAVVAGDVHEVDDDIWFLGTGVGAADLVLDELEETLAS